MSVVIKIHRFFNTFLILFITLAAFSRENSFATVVKFFNMNAVIDKLVIN